MTRFNPFDQQFADVDATQLAVLKNVSEGLYVEYKSQLPNASNLGKSLSSFANEDGGLLFIGIDEGSRPDGPNTAAAFPGIERDQVAAALDRIRDAASAHSQPIPPFDRYVIRGPAPDLGLTEDRSVIMVHVHRGLDPPYVHSSGRIYRRVADSSDPIPENDRHALDRLWRRRERALESLETALSYDPPLSQFESEHVSLMRLYLFADPYGERDLYLDLPFNDIRDILANGDAAHGGVPFDNVFPAGAAVVGRQTERNDPLGPVLTLRLNADCSAIATIPFSSSTFERPSYLAKFLAKYAHSERFIARCSEWGLTRGTLLDATPLINLFGGIAKKFFALLAANGTEQRELSFKVVAKNVWRRTPYLDLQSYISFIERNGLPIIQEDETWAPLHGGADVLGRINTDDIVLEKDESADDHTVIYHASARVLGWALPAVGIPAEVIVDGIDEVHDAVVRSVALPHGRNSRE